MNGVYGGEAQSMVISDARQSEVSMNLGDTYKIEIIEATEPIDILIFKNSNEYIDYMIDGSGECGVLGESIVEGDFEFEADEERVYIVAYILSYDAEEESHVQYKVKHEVYSEPETSSDDSPFLSPVLVILVYLVIGGIVYIRRGKSRRKD